MNVEARELLPLFFELRETAPCAFEEEQDCLSVESRPPKNERHRHGFSSCDLDLDRPMMLKITFLGKGFQKLRAHTCRSSERHTDTHIYT